MNLLRILAVVLIASVARAAEPPKSPPPTRHTPHDGRRLLVVRPGDFADAAGKRPARPKDRGAAFDGSYVALGSAQHADVTVRHAGKYTLWVRVGTPKDVRATLDVTLASGDRLLLRASALDGPGDAKRGGPAGYAAFAAKAKAKSPLRDPGVGSDTKGDPRKTATDDLDELTKDIAGQSAGVSDWTELTRLEDVFAESPYHWWKIGTVELPVGPARLTVSPVPGVRKGIDPRLDGAMLTTADDLPYPFAPEIAQAPASWIRFRIAALPKTGLTASAMLRIHSDPFSTGRMSFNPTGSSITKTEKHTALGFTRWYRLQDIERCPGFGAAQAHLLIALDGRSEPPAGAVGATQFAVYPHDDYVLREFEWSQPESLNISLATDFQTYLHLLRTARDHAREHYDKADAAGGGRVFPLTRGPLHFGNAWSASSGGTSEYADQTLRLLGLNCVGDGDDPVGSRARYGWTSQGGHYWPPSYMPHDEADAVAKYDAYYKDYFVRNREFYEGCSIFQVADEPGEIARTEMTAPVWRFDAKTKRWFDPTGSSELNTRRTDLRDCVLEGKIEKHGTWIGFRVAMDDPTHPKTYAYWRIGRVSASMEANLAAGRTGSAPAIMTKRGLAVGASPTAFKIVHDGSSAALYVGGRLVHQHLNLPKQGGFGFEGPSKGITELRIRPIRKDERLAGELPPDTDPGAKPKVDVGDLLDETKAGPETAAKPLEQFVNEDWTPAGGNLAAHAGFRKWAAAQGLKPELFGAKSWDDVRLLTVKELIRNPAEARLYYWSRRYSGMLTPHMFSLASQAIAKHAPNKSMLGFVALSGHSLNFPSTQPLDMFALAREGYPMIPGVSDWMSLGGWRWDSHQSVAYSVAPFNSGARRPGAEPTSYPMMHCVWPATIRSYTMLANNVRFLSYFNWGPMYAVTEGFWSEDDYSYRSVHATGNRAAQVDDILSNARMRPSRVALLYSVANEYWNAPASFADKRTVFLALSHEGFQPELVTEDQVTRGDLSNYDALFVLDPVVPADTATRIADWVRAGGLLHVSADALLRNEFDEPADALVDLAGIRRRIDAQAGDRTVTPVADGFAFRPHAARTGAAFVSLEPGSATVRAKYGDGRPAWVEAAVGKGRVVALAHRPGLTYTSQAIHRPGHHTAWADTGRAPLVQPLVEAKVARELILSDPTVIQGALSTDAGTVIILYNQQPAPRRKLRVSLREPAAPHSVQTFAGDTLVDLPFEFRDGRVEMTLDVLQAEQMILVRRKPAPADDRLDAMRAKTDELLNSSDWRSLCAGAFFAGRFPEWNFADRLPALLTHPKWEVRRAAVEALGRLKHKPAADAVFALLSREADHHVRGDALVALTRMGDPRAGEAAGRDAVHADAFVRLRALAALDELAATDAGRTLALPVFDKALADADPRIRRVALAAVARLDPARAVRESGSTSNPPAVRAQWLAAASDTAALLQREPALSDEELLALATQRAEPAVAAEALRRLDRLIKADANRAVYVAMRQRDPAYAKALLAHRKALPPATLGILPLALEATFDARLGTNLSDWESHLAR